MHRDIRELAVLLAAGLALGLAHLALRPDLPWVPAPRAEATMCGGEEPSAPAPLASPLSSEPEPLSSPAPEDAP